MGTTHVDLPPAGLTTSTFQNNRFRTKFGMTLELFFNQYLIKIIYLKYYFNVIPNKIDFNFPKADFFSNASAARIKYEVLSSLTANFWIILFNRE